MVNVGINMSYTVYHPHGSYWEFSHNAGWWYPRLQVWGTACAVAHVISRVWWVDVSPAANMALRSLQTMQLGGLMVFWRFGAEKEFGCLVTKSYIHMFVHGVWVLKLLSLTIWGSIYPCVIWRLYSCKGVFRCVEICGDQKLIPPDFDKINPSN